MAGVGANDRTKLEGYLDGIRAIERRLDHAEEESTERAAAGAGAPSAKAKDARAGAPPDLMIPTKAGIPTDYAEHANLMLDILTLAYWTDTTRVATFMFSFEKSWRAYPEIGAPEDHHHYSHHKNLPENLDALTKINTHHLTLFARFLGNLSRIKEGEGTLLDHCAFMYGSGISDGDKHNHEAIPVLLAGGCGGALNSSMHVALGKKTPVCNLYLAMMAMAGLELGELRRQHRPAGPGMRLLPLRPARRLAGLLALAAAALMDGSAPAQDAAPDPLSFRPQHPAAAEPVLLPLPRRPEDQGRCQPAAWTKNPLMIADHHQGEAPA